MNETLAATLRKNSIPCVLEPKNWPLRTKPSNAGHDGPDFLLFFENESVWVDLTIVTQTKKAEDKMARAVTLKQTQYEKATQIGIDVLPLVLSSFCSFHISCIPLFKKIQSQAGKKGVREVKNSIGVKIAKMLVFFKKQNDLKCFSAVA